MISIKLAFKNLIGAGLRTWLNTIVLSFAFVLIVFYNGLMDGWNEMAKNETKAWDVGQGQLWQPEYDPLDVFTYQDAHAPILTDVQKLITVGAVTPILIAQASAYPEGHMISVIMKGIEPKQTILKLPTDKLNVATDGAIPVLVGKRMADMMNAKIGDNVLVRWRDNNGTFDAKEVQIVDIFETIVPSVDNGVIWMPLSTMQEITNRPNEATYLVVGSKYKQTNIDNWQFKDHKFLFKDIDMLIATKKGGSSILWGLILVLALLAIFDTQVLSIFRRQKEIGTYIALGMTRWQVVRIFTIEGAAYSIFAAALAAVYGTPLFVFLAKNGLALPIKNTDVGIAMPEVMYPKFSLGLILSTIILVVLAATIVSFLPARKIAKLKPTDALKGKIQ